MPRVLVTPHLLRNVPGNYLDILVGGGFDVVYPPDHCDTLPLENITRLLPGMDAMLASTEPLGRDLLSKSQLRVIARMGVGYDAIDIPAATDLKIAVTITPGTLEESVAEHTLALMLGVSRDLCRRDREVRVGIWNRVPFPRMAGRTFGLVGSDAFGRAVVPKVQGLGMKVIAHDPFADRDYAAKHHVSLVSLAELFQQADVVSLHAPSTNDTNAMINAESLRQMKRGAILTTSGALVDEAALAAALQADHLLGACRGLSPGTVAAGKPAASLRECPVVYAHGGLGLRIDRRRQQFGRPVHCRSLSQPLAGRLRSKSGIACGLEVVDESGKKKAGDLKNPHLCETFAPHVG